MAGIIPKQFIEDLASRVDIVDVINDRVHLKKTGANHMACCPFHDEKTPSFSVNQKKQFYHCFGCGASGDVFKFLMEYERLSFTDSVEQLASKAGVEVPKEERTQQQKKQDETRKTLYTLMTDAARFYFKALYNSKAPRQYLIKRELNPKIAHQFGLGYAPEGWNNLQEHLLNHRYTDQQMIEAGMLIVNEDSNRRYDRFRHRVMFPIRDSRGRVIGFGGRVLDDSKPKYLNSPETTLFHKGRELYGLWEAKQHKDLTKLLVVEGYMDVVALAQFDILYAVATLGTAATEDHIRLAFKNVSELIFCFDGDEAGRKAASRALSNALPFMEDGRTVRFLFLPTGEDPDSMVRTIGKEQFERMINHAPPLEEFIFDDAGQQIDTQSMNGRARLARVVMPMINQLPDGIYKELMHDSLAKRTGLNRATIDRVISQESAEEKHTDTAPDNYPEYASEQTTNALARVKTSDPRRHMYRIIGCLVRHPKLVTLIPKGLSCGDEHDIILSELIEIISARPQHTQAQLLGYWYGQHGEQSINLIKNCISTTDLISQDGLEGELSSRVTALQKHPQKAAKQARLAILRMKDIKDLTDDERSEMIELVKKI